MQFRWRDWPVSLTDYANSDLENHIRQVSNETKEQVGGHLKVLSQRYGLIDKKLPIFASKKERKGRYYITDNFLRSWLGALSAPVSAVSFSPVEDLIAQADERLKKMILHQCAPAMQSFRRRLVPAPPEPLPGLCITMGVRFGDVIPGKGANLHGPQALGECTRRCL